MRRNLVSRKVSCQSQCSLELDFCSRNVILTANIGRATAVTCEHSLVQCLHAPRLNLKTTKKNRILTRIHPLHSIRKGIVRNEVITSPSWIRDDSMCRRQRRAQGDKRVESEEELHGEGVGGYVRIRWSMSYFVPLPSSASSKNKHKSFR